MVDQDLGMHSGPHLLPEAFIIGLFHDLKPDRMCLQQDSQRIFCRVRCLLGPHAHHLSCVHIIWDLSRCM